MTNNVMNKYRIELKYNLSYIYLQSSISVVYLQSPIPMRPCSFRYSWDESWDDNVHWHVCDV